jgi:energy-coupling factor transporter ATP-binding protein EcfA2
LPIDYRALTIKNFKSLRDVRVELGKLNVVVGPNGSGKSALLEALLFAREVARPRSSPPYPFARWWGYANIVHMHDASRNVEFAVEGSAPNGVPFHYRFVVNGAGDALKILEEELTVGDPGAGGVRLHRRMDIVEVHCSEAAIEPLRQAGVNVPPAQSLPVLDPRYSIFTLFPQILGLELQPTGAAYFSLLPNANLVKTEGPVSVAADPGVLDAFRDVLLMLLNDFVYLKFDPELAKKPSPPGLSLGEHGEALSSELFRHYNVVAGSTAIPEGYLNDFLNRHGLSLRLSSQGHDIVVQLGRSADGLVMDPPSIPDGYLKALALFHLLDMRPSLLLVDELENSLHLKLLELAMSAFRSSGTKVVVTTHSPMVVDLADPSELVMLSLSEGATVARRVGDPEAVRRRLAEEGMLLSESWLYGSLG